MVLLSSNALVPPLYWRELRNLPPRGIDVRREYVASPYVTPASAPQSGAFRGAGFVEVGNIGIVTLEAKRPQHLSRGKFASEGLAVWQVVGG